MIPYMASLGWYAASLAGEEAPPRKGRWNRTLIRPKGEEVPVLLTIPVAGGAHEMKTQPPSLWMADDRRNWRHVHLGAINAAYGKTPFYKYISPLVTDVLNDATIVGVSDIAAAIDRGVRNLLDLDKLMTALAASSDTRRTTYRDYAAEIEPEPDMQLSVLHYLFHYGMDTTFLLAAPLLAIME